MTARLAFQQLLVRLTFGSSPSFLKGRCLGRVVRTVDRSFGQGIRWVNRTLQVGIVFKEEAVAAAWLRTIATAIDERMTTPLTEPHQRDRPNDNEAEGQKMQNAAFKANFVC